jgi:uncharacterized membrane protein
MSKIMSTIAGEVLDSSGKIPVVDENGDGIISIKERVKAIMKNSDLVLTIIFAMLADPILVVLTMGFEGLWDFSPIMLALKTLVVPFIIVFIFKSNDKKVTAQDETIEKQKTEIIQLKLSNLLKANEISLMQSGIINKENYKAVQDILKPDIKTIK